MMKLARSGLFKLPAPLKTGHLPVVQPWFDSFEQMGSSVQHLRAVKALRRVARCGVRVLEQGQLRGLAHYPCSKSTGRGIEVLVFDSPVEMLPAGDSRAG